MTQSWYLFPARLSDRPAAMNTSPARRIQVFFMRKRSLINWRTLNMLRLLPNVRCPATMILSAAGKPGPLKKMIMQQGLIM
ncbi:MAG: hypothetical protein AVO38_14440 [delta proteobacterium ML8_D]|nr:MAG: hypothetical protein AVO38_14440 [delta proteobacterium ML8_D]